MITKKLNQLSADFFLTGGGTVYLFHPLTSKAKAWLALHCPRDGEHQYLGNALAVEHRYVTDIIAQAKLDGLTQFQHQLSKMEEAQ